MESKSDQIINDNKNNDENNDENKDYKIFDARKPLSSQCLIHARWKIDKILGKGAFGIVYHCSNKYTLTRTF